MPTAANAVNVVDVTRLITECTYNPQSRAFTFVLECGHRAPAPYTEPPAHIPMYAPCPDCKADTLRIAAKARKSGRKPGT